MYFAFLNVDVNVIQGTNWQIEPDEESVHGSVLQLIADKEFTIRLSLHDVPPGYPLHYNILSIFYQYYINIFFLPNNFPLVQ